MRVDPNGRSRLMIATSELMTVAIHVSVARLLANPIVLNPAALTRMIVVAANRRIARPDPSCGRSCGCAKVPNSDDEQPPN